MPDSKIVFTDTPLCLSLSQSLTYLSTSDDRTELLRQELNDGMALKKDTKVPKRTKEVKFLESPTSGSVDSLCHAGTSFQSATTPVAGAASATPFAPGMASCPVPARPQHEPADNVVSSAEKLITFKRSEVSLMLMLLLAVMFLLLLLLISTAGGSGTVNSRTVNISQTFINYQHTSSNPNSNPNPTIE